MSIFQDDCSHEMDIDVKVKAEINCFAVPAPVIKLPELQIRSLQSSVGGSQASKRFQPKFLREEAKLSTVVSAPEVNNCTGWKSLQDSVQVVNVEVPLETISNSCDLTQSDGSVYMFWIDAFEKAGVIYLFGKVA